MESGLWPPLRKSGLKIVDKSPRLLEEKAKLLALAKAKVTLSLEAKAAIRDDVFDSFQASNHKEAYQYALAHYEDLKDYSEEELHWLMEWRSALISSCNDVSLDIDTTDEDHYPRIQDFWGVQDLDWILFGVIRGDVSDDVPSKLSFSDILEQLTKVRNDKVRKAKIKYIQDFLRLHPEADLALSGTGSLQILTTLDTSKVQQYELRSYWETNIQAPREVGKGATIAIDAFKDKTGIYPDWASPFPEEFIPEEYKKYKTRILSEIKTRARNKYFTKLLKEVPNEP